MIRLYLNETQFNRILAPLVTEGAETLSSIYEKWYKDIDVEPFMKIVMADPTYNKDKGEKMGKYGKWMLGLYRKGKLKIEDLYKATEYLTYFNKYINKIQQKDIMSYKDLPSLYNAVSGFMEANNNGNNLATSKSDEIRRIKNNVKKVYEDENWLILIPLTKEASIFYGKNTQWCTAAERGNNMFDFYNAEGPLYININKRNNTKYQFHFETSSFMDERDVEINDPISETIGMDENVISKAYPNAIDTLLKDSLITSIGDGLYYNYRNSTVYRMYDAGMFQQEMGYARKEIVKVDGKDSCVRLSKDMWWFRKSSEAYGSFYNVRTDELTTDKRYLWLNTYKHPRSNMIYIVGSISGKYPNMHAFIGKMVNGELDIITYLHTDTVDMLDEYLEDNTSEYNVPRTVNRFVVTDAHETDALEDSDIVRLFDLISMKQIADFVVYEDSKYGSDDKYYYVFRDAITSYDAYQKAMEMYPDAYDEDYDQYTESTDYENEIVNDFVENEAKRYYICSDDGEIYDHLP